MRGIPSSFLIIFFASIFLIELISYYGFHILISRLSQKVRSSLMMFYILIGISIFGLLAYSFSNPEAIRQSRNYTLFFTVISLSFLNFLPKTLFSLITLISFIFQWLRVQRGQMIILAGAFMLSAGLFGTIAYGILEGRYDVRVVKRNLHFSDLPQQLIGLKIVHISDIHLGSYGKNPRAIQNAADIINEIQPDLLLFTGDIVNNFAEEIAGFEPYLKELSSKYGKFGILGNHDYGDYSSWPDSASKESNLEGIKNGLIQSGFKLLLNQSEKISIKDTSIFIIGVENWGHPPFPQYARLELAMDSVPAHSFKILLTHDPAHWKAKITGQTNISLTLAGHTHGGQFGIKLAGIEYSPIWLIQKNWGGLYQEDNQQLYVNRGLGTIGFPGRVDMRPEITVLTLHCSKTH